MPSKPSQTTVESNLREELLASRREYVVLLRKFNRLEEAHRLHHEKIAKLISQVTTQVIDELLTKD